MKNVNHAIFPGSFDPLTSGHIDIITRSLEVFERLTVGVLSHPRKEALFSLEERVVLVQNEFESFGERVMVESFSGLLVDFAQQKNATVIVRGLRAISDYDYEAQMALVNRSLCEEIETFFLMSREEYSYVSSSVVREVAAYGGKVDTFVSPAIAQALRKKFEDAQGT